MAEMIRARVTVWFNETRGSRFVQWSPRDHMVRSAYYRDHHVTVDVPEGEPWIYTVLDEMFLQGNADYRINGRNERSISVGDVIEVTVDGAATAIFACASFGWERVSAYDWEASRRVQFAGLS